VTAAPAINGVSRGIERNHNDEASPLLHGSMNRRPNYQSSDHHIISADSDGLVEVTTCSTPINNNNNNDKTFAERRSAVALEALAEQAS